MVICPIARMVHCTGCILVSFCPAKKILGDYEKTDGKCIKEKTDETSGKCDQTAGESSADKS